MQNHFQFQLQVRAREICYTSCIVVKSAVEGVSSYVSVPFQNGNGVPLEPGRILEPSKECGEGGRRERRD